MTEHFSTKPIKNNSLQVQLLSKIIFNDHSAENSAKIKPRQHILAIPLVTSPGIIRSEAVLTKRVIKVKVLIMIAADDLFLYSEKIRLGSSCKSSAWKNNLKTDLVCHLLHTFLLLLFFFLFVFFLHIMTVNNT